MHLRLLAHRRSRTILLVVSLLIGMAPPAAAQTAGTPGTITATDYANVRACPSTACDVLAQAPLGAALTITGATSDGWVPVVYQGQAGYVYHFYVDTAAVDDPWLTEGAPGCKRIALIFDIGIGEPPSQSVLNTLVQTRTPATMFAMGWWAEAFPGYLRQLRDAGFPIGTHGYSRQTLPGRSDAEIVADLNQSARAIEAVTGEPVTRFATPYAAETNTRVRSLIAQQGFLPVGWKVAGNDYAATADPNDVYNRVVGGAYDGAIVELHLDGAATDTSTGAVLPAIIRDLRAQGYQFVTIPQMANPCEQPAPPVTGKFASGDTVRTTDYLNLRSGASTGYGAITTLSPGTTGTVVGGPKTANGYTWWQLRTSQGTGWAAEDWLTGVSSTPPPAPPPATGKFATGDTIRTTDFLNLRSGPSTGSSVVAVLASNTAGTVIGGPRTGTGYTWWSIRTNSGTGWAAEPWLAKTAAPPSNTGGVPSTVQVADGPLNMRSGAGLTYGVLAVLPTGAQLSVVGGPVSASGYTWYKVTSTTYGTGWVASAFVR